MNSSEGYDAKSRAAGGTRARYAEVPLRDASR